MIRRYVVLFLIVVGIIGGYTAATGQSDLVEKNRLEQEAAIRKRIAALKAKPGGLYYSQSGLSPEEQEQVAKTLLEEIERLNTPQGFDVPDQEKIMAAVKELLLKAPDTMAAQMGHWNIHYLFMTAEDDTAAEQALLSYLDKYPGDEWHRVEAFDKLSVFAGEREDWGGALYWADRILALNPDRYPLILTKARALIRLGDPEGGRKLLERILQEAEGTVQYNLAQAELAFLAAGHPGAEMERPAEPVPVEDTAKALPPEPDPELKAAYELTMARIKQALIGAVLYHTEFMKLPGSLAELLPAGYIKEEQTRDAWGRPLIFKPDPGRAACWVASAGSDGEFKGFDQEGTYAEFSGQDIIGFYMDFVFAPDFQ